MSEIDELRKRVEALEARQVPDDVLFPDRTHGTATVRHWRGYAERAEQANREWQVKYEALSAAATDVIGYVERSANLEAPPPGPGPQRDFFLLVRALKAAAR